MTKIYDNWKDFPMDQWNWPDFSPEEIACRGTGNLMIVPHAMDKLQALRASGVSRVERLVMVLGVVVFKFK